MENLRLQRQQEFSLGQQQRNQEFEAGRDVRREGFETRRDTSRQAFESGQNLLKLRVEQQNRGSDRDLKREELAQDKELKGNELESREQLTRDELAMKGKYYEAMANHYNTLTGQGRKAGASADTKKSVEYLQHILGQRIKGLQDMRALASPDEQDQIDEEIQSVMREARQVANLSELTPLAQNPIKDRFAQPSINPGGYSKFLNANPAIPPSRGALDGGSEHVRRHHRKVP
jgi:hypothetical protein